MYDVAVPLLLLEVYERDAMRSYRAPRPPHQVLLRTLLTSPPRGEHAVAAPAPLPTPPSPSGTAAERGSPQQPPLPPPPPPPAAQPPAAVELLPSAAPCLKSWLPLLPLRLLVQVAPPPLAAVRLLPGQLSRRPRPLSTPPCNLSRSRPLRLPPLQPRTGRRT